MGAWNMFVAPTLREHPSPLSRVCLQSPALEDELVFLDERSYCRPETDRHPDLLLEALP